MRRERAKLKQDNDHNILVSPDNNKDSIPSKHKILNSNRSVATNPISTDVSVVEETLEFMELEGSAVQELPVAILAESTQKGATIILEPKPPDPDGQQVGEGLDSMQEETGQEEGGSMAKNEASIDAMQA